jgi:hypothetical protein
VTATKILSGEQGEIQIEFGEPVVAGTVTINGLDTDMVGNETIWTATTLEVLSGTELIETVDINIQGFTSADTAKEMDVYLAALPTDLVINLSIGTMCYGGNSRDSVSVTGTAHGVTSGALVSLELLDTSNTIVEQTTTTVDSNGLWSLGNWDLSSQAGNFSVKATLHRGAIDTTSASEDIQLEKRKGDC